MVFRKRPAELTDKRPTLDAMGRCRDALINVRSTVAIGGPIYQAAGVVTKAIDAFAGLLTGDPTYYHSGGSAPCGGDGKWRDSGR